MNPFPINFSDCPYKWFDIDRTTGKKVPKWSYCRRATCDVCKVRRSNLMTAMLLNQMTGRSCWHLTLTVQHAGGCLRPLLVDLFDNFTRLRGLADWRHQILGGARFLHVTHNVVNKTWGPHLHVIAEATTVNLMAITSQWVKITGGSHQVWCRPVPEALRDRKIIACYVTKPPFESFAADEMLVNEYVGAVKRRKPARGFGTWHRLKLLPRRRPPLLAQS